MDLFALLHLSRPDEIDRWNKVRHFLVPRGAFSYTMQLSRSPLLLRLAIWQHLCQGLARLLKLAAVLSICHFVIWSEPHLNPFHTACAPLRPGIWNWSWKHYVSHITELRVEVREFKNSLQVSFSSGYFTGKIRWITFFSNLFLPCDQVILQLCKFSFTFISNWLFLVWGPGAREVLTYIVDFVFATRLDQRNIFFIYPKNISYIFRLHFCPWPTRVGWKKNPNDRPFIVIQWTLKRKHGDLHTLNLINWIIG